MTDETNIPIGDRHNIIRDLIRGASLYLVTTQYGYSMSAIRKIWRQYRKTNIIADPPGKCCIIINTTNNNNIRKVAFNNCNMYRGY